MVNVWAKSVLILITVSVYVQVVWWQVMGCVMVNMLLTVHGFFYFIVPVASLISSLFQKLLTLCIRRILFLYNYYKFCATHNLEINHTKSRVHPVYFEQRSAIDEFSEYRNYGSGGGGGYINARAPTAHERIPPRRWVRNITTILCSPVIRIQYGIQDISAKSADKIGTTSKRTGEPDRRGYLSCVHHGVLYIDITLL